MGKKSKHRKKKQKQPEFADEAIENASVSSTVAATSTKYSVTEILDRAEAYVDSFEHGLAQRFCQRALDMASDDLRALELSATLHLQTGDVATAKKCLERAILLSPDEGHAKYMYMGQLQSGMDAVQFFTKGVDIMRRRIAADQARMVEDGVAAAGERKVEVTPRDLSSAYCSIAEIYLTDACFEEDADVKCKEHLDKAVEADPDNADAYHLLASYWLCKHDRQMAKECVDKGVSLWLPQLREADKPEGATLSDPVQVCSVSGQARVSYAKVLIELEEYKTASEILEFLLDEDDEVVEVWFLLGWLNVLQGSDFKANARCYLQKASEVASKTKCEDEQMVAQIADLLTELGPEVATEEDGMDAEDTSDSDDSTDSDIETRQRQSDAMDH